MKNIRATFSQAYWGCLSNSNRPQVPPQLVVTTAVWWHAQAGIMAAQEPTELGVDAFTLTQYLIPALREFNPCI